MNQILEQEDIIFTRQNSEPLLTPDFEVCGADINSISYWNAINSFFSRKVDQTEGEYNRIINRYFAGSAIEMRSIISPSYILSHEICTFVPKCKECPLKYNCAFYRSNDERENPITFADFFAGAGGLSLGFEHAGLYPVLANDIDPWFMATYKYNRPNYSTEISACDIQTWLMENELRSDWEIDIVSGGVPCQSFSMANRQRKADDPRDKLYSALMRAAGLIKPKVILIENVSGMIKEFDGVQSDLAALGYSSDHIIINSKDYGIPQSRKRLFFVAFSKNHFNDSADRVHRVITNIRDLRQNHFVTLREAIADLPALSAHTTRNDTKFNNEVSGRSFLFHELKGASEYALKINENKIYTPLFNHKARYNNSRDIEIFHTLKPGENSLAESIKHIMPYSDRNGIFKDKYYKLQYNTYSKTITAHMRYDCNMYIHPEQARGLTAREAARVQSFPDDYVFLGNFQRLYQQVGNAVPPLLAKILAKAIKNNIN